MYEKIYVFKCITGQSVEFYCKNVFNRDLVKLSDYLRFWNNIYLQEQCRRTVYFTDQTYCMLFRKQIHLAYAASITYVYVIEIDHSYKITHMNNQFGKVSFCLFVIFFFVTFLSLIFLAIAIIISSAFIVHSSAHNVFHAVQKPQIPI